MAQTEVLGDSMSAFANLIGRKAAQTAKASLQEHGVSSAQVDEVLDDGITLGDILDAVDSYSAETLGENPDAVQPRGMMVVGMVTDAGNPRLSGVVAGTLGPVGPDGVFSIDADYQSLAYLYTLMSASALSTEIPENGITRLQVPSALYPAVKASMISIAAANWQSMYKVLGGQAVHGLSAGAVAAERDLTQQNVSRYLASTKLRKFSVPVEVCAEFEHDESGPMVPDQLSEAALLNPQLVTVLEDVPVKAWSPPEDQLAGPCSERGVLNVPYGVIGVTVHADMVVYAASLDDARQVAAITNDLVQACGHTLRSLRVLQDAKLSVYEVVRDLESDHDYDFDR